MAQTAAGSRTDVAAVVPELFRQHYHALVRLALHLVDDLDSAEDVVQDVFAALQSNGRTTGLDDPRRYLRTAVVNRARSVLRRRSVARTFWSRRTRRQLDEPADEAALRRDERDRMLAAIAGLPRRQREVVVLRYYEELSVAEIAEVLATSPSAVSSALTRALDGLTTIFGECHGD